jgi:hypothetical protein
MFFPELCWTPFYVLLRKFKILMFNERTCWQLVYVLCLLTRRTFLSKKFSYFTITSGNWVTGFTSGGFKFLPSFISSFFADWRQLMKQKLLNWFCIFFNAEPTILRLGSRGVATAGRLNLSRFPSIFCIPLNLRHLRQWSYPFGSFYLSCRLICAPPPSISTFGDEWNFVPICLQSLIQEVSKLEHSWIISHLSIVKEPGLRGNVTRCAGSDSLICVSLSTGMKAKCRPTGTSFHFSCLCPI